MSQSSIVWRHYMADDVSPEENSVKSSNSESHSLESETHISRYHFHKQNQNVSHSSSFDHRIQTMNCGAGRSDGSARGFGDGSGNKIPSGYRSSQVPPSPSETSPVMMRDTLGNPGAMGFSDKPDDQESDMQYHDKRSDSLIQTDHTESPESVEISLPYYNISNYSQSVNTSGMLARSESRTGHTLRSGTSGVSSAGKGSATGHSVKRTSLNQVPPRFSQFITDQATLHPKSPANHLVPSDPSQSGGRQHAPNPGNGEAEPREKQKPSALTRDISNSMDSQATIFSTKPRANRAGSGPGWAGRSLRRRLTSRARVSSRNNSSSVNPGSCEETASSLKRAKAIRYTGKTRQIRMYMRQLYQRLKRRLAAAFTFSAAPKRATSTVKMKRRTLVRKKRSNPKNPSVRRNLALISGPLENPTFTGAQPVDRLTEDLKRSAGAAGDPRVSDLCNERLGKYNHLSTYLEEQQQLSQPVAHPSSIEHSEVSSAPPPPPHRCITPAEMLQNPSDWTTSRENPQSQGLASSHVPASAHVPASSHFPAASGSEEQLKGAWKSYLANVLSQRIRLRQEIFLFQTLLANEPVPEFFARHSDDIVSEILSRHSTLGSKSAVARNQLSSLTSLVPSMPRLPSAMSSKAEGMMDGTEQVVERPEYATSIGSSETSSISSRFDDDNVSEFQKVLNRRSMLGDMLSYDSEEFLSDDTLSKTESEPESSTAASHSMYTSSNPAASCNILVDPHHTVLERYGTVCRRAAVPKRTNTDKSSMYSSSIQGSTYLITRSPGISSNLCGQT